MAAPAGFEPAIFALTTRHPSPLNDGAQMVTSAKQIRADGN